MEVPSWLGCPWYGQRVEVDLIGGLSLQAGVRSDVVVELDVPSQGGSRFVDRVVGSEVDLFVLDRSPDSLHEDIVAPAALAVHADGNSIVFSCGVKATLENWLP